MSLPNPTPIPSESVPVDLRTHAGTIIAPPPLDDISNFRFSSPRLYFAFPFLASAPVHSSYSEIEPLAMATALPSLEKMTTSTIAATAISFRFRPRRDAHSRPPLPYAPPPPLSEVSKGAIVSVTYVSDKHVSIFFGSVQLRFGPFGLRQARLRRSFHVPRRSRPWTCFRLGVGTIEL